MTIKMLVFDFRDSEHDFFRNNNLENFDITYYEEPLNEETVKQLSQEERDNTNIISVFISSDVTRKVIEEFKNLRIISARSTGIDHISKSGSLEKNIAVVNVEHYGSTSVAQYTFTLILALVRNLIPAVEYLKSGHKTCADFVGRDLSKLTLGVVGTGSIGTSVCQIGKAFGMKVLANDLIKKNQLIKDFNVEYVTIDKLIEESDVISVNVPFTGDNFHMFGQEQFESMKDGAYFVNTSRGEVVDTIAAYDALVSGKLNGLALDVVACEDVSFKCSKFFKDIETPQASCAAEAEVVKKLVKMPNAIITPHIAYETQDAIDYILGISFDAIRDTIKGGAKYRVV